jgi:glucose/arabinose dehydrogenase
MSKLASVRRISRLSLLPVLLYACSSGNEALPGSPDATAGGKTGSPDAAPAADAGADGDATTAGEGGEFDAPGPLDGNFGWDVTGVDAAIAHPCSLPGSVQHTATGVVVVPGGTGPDLSWVNIPTGFCVHYYGTVDNVRQLRFAPGGELFVTSPTTGTTGGGLGGLSAIAVLSDDNHDGVADSVLTYLDSLPSTQGILFTDGFLYYQNNTQIMRVPYAIGDRTASGGSQLVADITIYQSGLHWPKTFDIADDGSIYVGNGGDQGETCDPSRPFHGGILKLDGSPGGAPVAKGLRNPIAVRCARGHDQCFAVELALDGSNYPDKGREKLIPIRQGDDWGFPCCGTRNAPYAGIMPVPDCSGVALESDSFVIGDTPFGLDFEPGLWPAPWTGDAILTLHGTAGAWYGARLVAIAMDPTTGLPVNGSDLDGSDTGGMSDFATGWDDGNRDHGRPAALSFSPDGRLFLGNDNDGTILWMAPLSL